MCGRFTLTQSPDAIAHSLNLPIPSMFAPRYNIAPTQPVMAVRSSEEKAERQLTHFTWGLIPSWAKDPKIGAKMINARAETLSEKPSFRAAFKRRRCLVLADGFYEWQKLAKGKQPMHFSLQDHQPFGFAGLWEHWQSAEGSEIESCTVITTAANDLMRPVHDRMPVILAPQDYDAWLDPQNSGDRLQSLLRPYAAAEMTAYPVSTQVNNPRHETPDCIAPLEVNPSDAAHDDPALAQNSR
ncbi:MAG TPA: SOS response-associated peptidase [Coleofasciculaceae cyanobacterium]|jgi:putative SOS response-associated peptidase YedK